MRGVTIAVYLACAAALAALELTARHSTLPTISSVLRWAARRRSTQIGLVMAWWWIGWHFLGSAA